MGLKNFRAAFWSPLVDDIKKDREIPQVFAEDVSMRILKADPITPEEEVEAIWEAMTDWNYSPREKIAGKKLIM